jgi:hypothetical protein
MTIWIRVLAEWSEREQRAKWNEQSIEIKYVQLMGTRHSEAASQGYAKTPRMSRAANSILFDFAALLVIVYAGLLYQADLLTRSISLFFHVHLFISPYPFSRLKLSFFIWFQNERGFVNYILIVWIVNLCRYYHPLVYSIYLNLLANTCFYGNQVNVK